MLQKKVLAQEVFPPLILLVMAIPAVGLMAVAQPSRLLQLLIPGHILKHGQAVIRLMPICIVTMTGNKSVTATFTLNNYTLTATKTGSGSGTISGSGISCGPIVPERIRTIPLSPLPPFLMRPLTLPDGPAVTQPIAIHAPSP